MESHLAGCSQGPGIDLDILRSVSGGRKPSEDELTAAVNALVTLGILSRTANGLELSVQGLRSTAGYRRGIREGLAARATSNDAALAAALPPGLPQAARDVMQAEAWDLRASLIDCIAGAHHRIVLASPFWDEETADDLAELLNRRLAAGVVVDLLGREVGGPTASGQCLAALVGRLGHSSRLRATGWLKVAPNDSGLQTFHFKCAVADGGKRAYLGSANFTTGGLRSRMELGVILSGTLASALARILDSALEVAHDTRDS